MTNVVFNKVERLNYIKQISPKDCAYILGTVTLDTLQAKVGKDDVYVLGSNVNMAVRAHFFDVRPGDWFAFFDNNGLSYVAQIIHTIRSQQLSMELWYKSEYEYICFFKNICFLPIPYDKFNSAIGYDSGWYVRGTTFPRHDVRSKAAANIETAPKTEIKNLMDIEKASDGDDIGQKPMLVEGFTVIDKLNLTNIPNELKKMVDDIVAFHSGSEFDVTSYINTSNRQLKNIPIFIENGPDINDNNATIDKKIDELEHFIDNIDGNNLELDIELLRRIVAWLRDRMKVTGEFGSFIKSLSEFGKQGVKIRNMILSIEDKISDIVILGVFCSDATIHLYHDRITASAKDNSYDLIEHMACVAAHEMEHAWHYADVKSQSGKWHLHDIPEYKWVKETIAEYFCLCYCKKAGNTAVILRDKLDFPYDGGYSGALILEENPTNFVKVYKESLNDMEKAFNNINI